MKCTDRDREDRDHACVRLITNVAAGLELPIEGNSVGYNNFGLLNYPHFSKWAELIRSDGA